jgi:hypothetical protein
MSTDICRPKSMPRSFEGFESGRGPIHRFFMKLGFALVGLNDDVIGCDVGLSILT